MNSKNVKPIFFLIKLKKICTDVTQKDVKIINPVEKIKTLIY